MDFINNKQQRLIFDAIIEWDEKVPTLTGHQLQVCMSCDTDHGSTPGSWSLWGIEKACKTEQTSRTEKLWHRSAETWTSV